MDDDLATPEGIATMFETIRRANAALDEGEDSAATLVATAIDLAGAMGLGVEPDGLGSGSDGGDPEIDALVSARNEARANKDFAEADRIRDVLTARGIVVEDTPNGPVWHRG
jgi:cysteinyl-tRNA synthetase